MPRPFAARDSRQAGFTLLELMVALALAAMISGMISYVSIQANNVYRLTTDKVEVYQKFRYALSDLQNSMQNIIPTADLEFFVDRRNQDLRGHWEEGEEFTDVANLGGGRAGYYDEGAQVVERTYTVQALDGTSEEHDDFSMYFKTMAEVDGVLQVSNVEYFLADPVRLASNEPARIEREVLLEPGKSFQGYVLVKIIRYVDVPDLFSPGKRDVKVKTLELCQNVTDLKIEYFYDNLHGDAKAGRYLTPQEERNELVKPEIAPKTLDERYGGGVMKEFLYGGFRPPFVQGTAFPSIRNSKTGEFKPVYFTLGSSESGINFSELRYNDRIFLWSDSGTSQWPAGEFTVERNENGRLFFQEEISSAFWSGPQAQIRFRAGYVPSAFRVSVRVLNDKGNEPRLLTQIVRTLRRQ